MVFCRRGLPAATKVVALLICVGAGLRATSQTIPPHKAEIVLFDGSNLNQFDTFLKSKGLNSDPDHVFLVENGVIHVSGKEMGYIITKQPYHDFYLRAEFKWGEGTYGEREGQARDSGILFNVQGEQKVWPRSIEFQITEGGTGDFWMTDGAALTGRDGKRVEGPPGSALKIDRFGKGPSQNVVGFRDPVGELEKPHGEWNVLELVTQRNNVKQYVNGKLANEGTNPFPAEGKILFQSEGAEVFFRDMKLYPLK
jgi:Domain of Unknown Function (DUF1080)